MMSDCNNRAIESVCVEITDHEALVTAEAVLLFIWCVVCGIEDRADR